MPRKRKPDPTFTVILKPSTELFSGEPHVIVEIAQPVCFGRATLILSEKDIETWEGVLEKGKAMIRERRENGAPVDATGEPIKGE